jgi:predicted N-acetyltransferase YhbS
VIRSLTPGDVDRCATVFIDAFADLDRRHGDEVREVPPERRERLLRRLRRFTETDPEGAFVAEVDGAVAGYAIAIRREDLWGLAQLFVHPDHQGAGLGKRLLDATRGCADGARVELIMASHDARAIRRYAALGLALHPAMGARGEVDRAALPAGLPVREGAEADLDLVDDVDRRVRTVPRTGDVAELLTSEPAARLLVADGAGSRGFALHTRGNVALLGADDEATAAALLWSCLAEAEDEVQQWGWTAAQRWAFDVAVAARLALQPAGPMFVRGWRALPGPYLPSGIHF